MISKFVDPKLIFISWKFWPKRAKFNHANKRNSKVRLIVNNVNDIHCYIFTFKVLFAYAISRILKISFYMFLLDLQI